MPELWHVDAFTDRPFAGNPAAVCFLDQPREDAWYQSVAAEMNLSETAFLLAEGEAYQLRWFTPSVEVDLCGHATLASAHALWRSERLPEDAVATFATRSGRLTAERENEWIVLDFPATPPAAADEPPGLRSALGLEPVEVARTRFDLFVVVREAGAIRGMTPHLEALAKIPARGIVVTAPGDGEGVDFVSRFFAPSSGVAEDPVTGSAHCALGPYWAGRLGRTTLVGYQASARGGRVRVEVAGDRVRLGGKAVTVLRGRLEI